MIRYKDINFEILKHATRMRIKVDIFSKRILI